MHEDTYEPRPPRLVLDPRRLGPTVRKALEDAGLHHLYSHQADALTPHSKARRSITTGTASGKSLCFQLPTLEVLTADRRARALYLYPTKALAQDQARALHGFGLHKHIRPAIYDGDTPRAERAAIRKRSNLVITNPDMLHVGILPEPPRLGRAALQPRVRGRRRGARVPRRVRLARRQRAPPAPPHRRDPRLESALPADQRDDRQPARARRAAHGPRRLQADRP